MVDVFAEDADHFSTGGLRRIQGGICFGKEL